MEFIYQTKWYHSIEDTKFSYGLFKEMETVKENWKILDHTVYKKNVCSYLYLGPPKYTAEVLLPSARIFWSFKHNTYTQM
jgi:hypothetical protein